jgi:flagellar hook-associated protein 3 FlgL
MRVTTTSYADNLITHLQALARRQSNLQNQISTNQRIQTAEEDPLAMQQVLNLRDDSAASEQYAANIQTHQEYASVTGDLLKSLTKIIDRAQELAVSADGTDSPDTLAPLATELEQLIQHAVQLVNTQYRGEYLLAGTKSDAAPFTSATDAQGTVTSVAFNGNTSVAASEIAPGLLISSRVAGENNTGSGGRGLLADSRFGADFFAHLITLQKQLSTGDLTNIAQSRTELKADEDNIIYHVGDNAALQSRLEASLNTAKDNKLNLEGQISRRAAADLPSTIVRLNQSQTSYQATLQSAASIMNLTLLDFLR